VSMWFLPSDGVELNVKKNYNAPFVRVDFKNMISAQKAKIQKVQVSTTSTGISITNMILKGLYGTKSSGFVIVSLKASPKATSIIGIGEIYSGYKLQSISKESALFSKKGTTFILYLENVKTIAKNIQNTRLHKKVNNHEDELVTPVVVTRADIEYYAKNPKKIWKEISIVEVKDANGLKGFKVTRIERNSLMASLGLQKGDLIIKANNIELKSYRDALDIYAKIKEIDVIQIVVIRNEIQKELVYEIN